MTTWHVVTSGDGTILAVFGAALLADAKAHAQRLTDSSGVHRVRFYVDTVTRAVRPHVGGKLDARLPADFDWENEWWK